MNPTYIANMKLTNLDEINMKLTNLDEINMK